MRNKYAILVLVFSFAFSQTQNYAIQLVNESFVPDANAEEWLDKVLEKKPHTLLQFFEIPTDEQRMQLSNAGISLSEYLPRHTYLATFEEGANFSLLKNLKLRAAFPLDARFKLT
jgi:hypothetical protein